MAQRTVRHNVDRSRYELVVDDQVVGIADYDTVGEQLVFPHTEIEAALRGHGHGAALVRGALDDVRRRGHTVVPHCWFVRQFIDEHPDYADLLGH